MNKGNKLGAVFFGAALIGGIGGQYWYESVEQTVEAQVVALDDTTPVFGALFNEASIKVQDKNGDTFHLYNKPTYFADRDMKPSDVAQLLEVGETYSFDLIGSKKIFSPNISKVTKL